MSGERTARHGAGPKDANGFAETGDYPASHGRRPGPKEDTIPCF